MAATGRELRAVAAVFGLARSLMPVEIFCLTVNCADGERRTFTGDEADVPWWDLDATELSSTAA